MKKEGQKFVLDTLLPPGYYEYKFVVDGMWSLDEFTPYLSIDGYSNHQLIVFPAIRARLKSSEGSGRPRMFLVNPRSPLDETVQRAKLSCGLEDDKDYELVLKPAHHRGLIITSSNDIQHNDLLCLCQVDYDGERHSVESEDSGSESSSSSEDSVGSVARELSRVQLFRTDNNEVVFTGTSLQDAQQYATENKDKIKVPLRLVVDKSDFTNKKIVCA